MHSFTATASWRTLIVLTTCTLLQACSQFLHPDRSPATTDSQHCIQLTASVVYADADQTFKQLRARILVLRGKYIQFSIRSRWGPELLRGLVTPTSIKVVNHIQKSHWSGSYSKAYQLQGCLWSYNIIESALLGHLLKHEGVQGFAKKNPWRPIGNILCAEGKRTTILKNKHDDTQLHISYTGVLEQEHGYKQVTLQMPYTVDGSQGFMLAVKTKKRVQLAHQPSWRFIVPSRYEKA